MPEELTTLQPKPTRRKVQKEAEQAAERAYQRSYREAAIEAARVEGAAKGAADAAGGGIDAPAGAVEAARQRALNGGGAKPQVSPWESPGQKDERQLSGQRVKHSSGVEVPVEFYDLDSGSQQRFLSAVQERETKEADDNLALKSVNQVLDIQDRDRARIRELEGQLSTVLSIVEAQQRQISGLSTQIEVGKSEALLEQQAGIGQDVANLSAIRAEAAAEMAEYNRQREAAAAENRAALEATATAVEALRGSVQSASTIYQEGIVANQNQLAAVDAGVRKLDVQLQELEGKTDAWTDPITRAEVQGLITDAVASEWRAQQEAITEAVVKDLRDEFPAGVHGPRVDGERARQQRSDAANYSDPVGGPR